MMKIYPRILQQYNYFGDGSDDEQYEIQNRWESQLTSMAILEGQEIEFIDEVAVNAMEGTEEEKIWYGAYCDEALDRALAMPS